MAPWLTGGSVYVATGRAGLESSVEVVDSSIHAATASAKVANAST